MSATIIDQLYKIYENKAKNQIRARQKELAHEIKEAYMNIPKEELVRMFIDQFKVNENLLDYQGNPRSDAYIELEIRIPVKDIIKHENIDKINQLVNVYNTLEIQLDTWKLKALEAKASKQDVPPFEFKVEI